MCFIGYFFLLKNDAKTVLKRGFNGILIKKKKVFFIKIDKF